MAQRLVDCPDGGACGSKKHDQTKGEYLTCLKRASVRKGGPKAASMGIAPTSPSRTPGSQGLRDSIARNPQAQALSDYGKPDANHLIRAGTARALVEALPATGSGNLSRIRDDLTLSSQGKGNDERVQLSAQDRLALTSSLPIDVASHKVNSALNDGKGTSPALMMDRDGVVIGGDLNYSQHAIERLGWRVLATPEQITQRLDDAETQLMDEGTDVPEHADVIERAASLIESDINSVNLDPKAVVKRVKAEEKWPDAVRTPEERDAALADIDYEIGVSDRSYMQAVAIDPKIRSDWPAPRFLDALANHTDSLSAARQRVLDNGEPQPARRRRTA